MTDDDGDDAAFELVLPFDCDDPQFARGFQLGVLWTLARNDVAGEVYVSAESVEMVARIRERFPEVPIVVHDEGPEWIRVEVLAEASSTGGD